MIFLVSHLRLSQWKDDSVEGWLKPFYCHNTLPATAHQLFLQLVLFLEHQPLSWPGFWSKDYWRGGGLIQEIKCKKENGLCYIFMVNTRKLWDVVVNLIKAASLMHNEIGWHVCQMAMPLGMVARWYGQMFMWVHVQLFTICVGGLNKFIKKLSRPKKLNGGQKKVYKQTIP